MLIFGTILFADLSRDDTTGIVTDSSTELQWQDDYSDNGGSVKNTDWTNAIAYCEALELGDYVDWRLPNKKELLSIVSYSNAIPSLDEVFATYSRTDYSRYFSSTTASTKSYVWHVFFNYGYSNIRLKTDSGNIRCVRGGE